MATTRLTFHVLGHPQPAGSKRAFAIRKAGAYTGRVAVSDDNPRAKSWQLMVANAGAEAAGDVFYDEPIGVYMAFTLARPKGHYGTGARRGLVRESAPRAPAVRPDVLKLARAVEDALTGVLWRDDALIVHEELEKWYGTPEGVTVRIWPT